MGALLDPVADKALLVTMYVTLAAVEALPDWLAILVVFRDVVIVGGVVVLSVLGQSVLIRPLYISKLNTVLQIVLVAVTLLLSGFGLGRAGRDDRSDLAGRGDHIRLRRGLCLGDGTRPMTERHRTAAARSTAAAQRPDLVRRGRRPLPGQATRGQRVALVVGLLVVAWLALQLFASVLAPFVAAAGIAYVLDPPTTRLTRLGLAAGSRRC